MKFSYALRKLGCAVVVTAATGFPAHAGFIALDSSRIDGNQSYAGWLGIDFNVNSAVRVTHLGTFEDDSNGFPAGGTINVGIFDRTTMALVVGSPTVTFSSGSPGVVMGTGSNNRFIDVIDFILAPGNYSILSHGYGATEENGNQGLGGTGPAQDTGGGLITFTQTVRSGLNVGLWPTILVVGAPGATTSRYDAGSFIFEAAPAAVPEPATLALLGLGLAGLAFRRRKPQA